MDEIATQSETAFTPLTARAVLVGERIDTAGLERSDALSTAPLAFRVGEQVRIAGRSPARLLAVAFVLARSVVPAHHEHQVAEVLETIEPWASDLARNGRRRGGRRAVIRLIGSALLVEHQVSGRFTIGEKPDLLWDRPDLERLYARLETDLIDTERSLRLEAVVVALILAELALGILEMVRG